MSKKKKQTVTNPGGVVVRSVKKKDGSVKIHYSPGGYHEIIIGTTGSGKSQGVIIPSILSIATSGGSMIVNDVKGELYAKTSEYLKRKGYTVYLMDYFNPMAGSCFNQLYMPRRLYEEGLPHLYASKALKELLGLITILQNPSNPPEVLKYLKISQFVSKLPPELNYLKEDPERCQKVNIASKEKQGTLQKGFEVLHIATQKVEPSEALSNISSLDATQLIKILRDISVYTYEMIQADAKAKGDGSMTDCLYNNEYLRVRQERTCTAMNDILRITSAENIGKYYSSKIAKNNIILETVAEGTSNYDLCTRQNLKYNQILDELKDGLTWDMLIDFYTDMYADHVTIWDDYETNAVDAAGTIAKMIIGEPKGDPFWTITAESLVKSLILMVCRETHLDYSAHLGSVSRILSTLSQMDDNDKTGIDKILSKFSDGDPVKLSQSAMSAAGDKTKSSILSSAIAPLGIFNNKSIVDQSSRLDFEPQSLINDKVAVFLCTPGKDDSGLAQYVVLSTLFIEQCYSALNTAISKTQSQTSPRPIFFLLDEICNAPPIPGLGAKVALARSKNMWFALVVQAYEQLKTVYKEECETIKENSNILYLLSNNTGTAKEISDRIGKTTVEINSISSSFSKGTDSSSNSTSTSLTGRELMTPQELMQLKSGEGILMLQRQNPYKTILTPAWQFGCYKWLSDNTVNNIHVRRNPQEVNYFCPEPNKFTAAYELLDNGCLLDKYFYNILSSLDVTSDSTTQNIE